jgi:hypothetical protein
MKVLRLSFRSLFVAFLSLGAFANNESYQLSKDNKNWDNPVRTLEIQHGINPANVLITLTEGNNKLSLQYDVKKKDSETSTDNKPKRCYVISSDSIFGALDICFLNGNKNKVEIGKSVFWYRDLKSNTSASSSNSEVSLSSVDASTDSATSHS